MKDLHRSVVISRLPHLRPVAFEGTDVILPTGWAGVNPLPARRAAGPVLQTLWVVPKRYRKALRENGHGISVVLTAAPNGTPEISITIPEIKLTKDAREEAERGATAVEDEIRDTICGAVAAAIMGLRWAFDGASEEEVDRRHGEILTIVERALAEGGAE